jgi:polar amino acid transport system substrate-binding protein
LAANNDFAVELCGWIHQSARADNGRVPDIVCPALLVKFPPGGDMHSIFRICVPCLASLLLLAPSVEAKEVRIAFGLAIPPYVIEDKDAGFEVDIMREALAVKGHTLKPVYAASATTVQLLKDGKIDGAQRGNPDLVDGTGVYYASQPAVVYQDYAITLKKNNLPIDSLADLKGKSIAAYMGATKFIGPDYAAAVKDNPKYQEVSNQKRQSLMLFSNGIDVVISDINIFKYFRSSEQGQVDTKQEIVFHKIFADSTLKTNNPIFVDKQIRDDFDAGLKQLKTSGRYQQIIKKYITE